MALDFTGLTSHVDQAVADENSAIAAMTQLVPVNIAIVNQSTVLTDAQVAPVVAALQIQVVRDFAPTWGKVAKLWFYSKTAVIPPAYWQLVITDDADVADALGYHETTASGQPLGKVFARTTIADGLQWTVTVSHELCITGDTMIPLLDGRTVSVQDLVGVDHFWVYSCKENGELRPGRAHSVRKTRKNAPLVKVTLDNGECVRCTPDHTFLMRDGSYTAAGSLRGGDSLMPLYRRQSILDAKVERKGMYEYEEVFVPATESWKFTHRMVMPFCPRGYVRHHKDFTRTNNSPDNLELLTWPAHQKLHAEHIKFYREAFDASGRRRNISALDRAIIGETSRVALLEYNGSAKHKADLARYWAEHPEARVARGDELRAYASSQANIDRITELARTPERRVQSSRSLTAYNKSDEHRDVARGLGRKIFAEFWADPEFIAAHKARTQELNHERWHVRRGIVKPDCQLCAVAGDKAFAAAVNHKVVSVEDCGTEDVYDFTVDKYHNFALACGVFVHNCEMLVDPWINIAAEYDDATGAPTKFYSFEVADACEDDQFSYLINGVSVSDFVTPNWFMPGTAAPYDFGRHIAAPFALLAGGYIGELDVTAAGWQQLNADKETAPRGARLTRRRLPRRQWRRSTL